MSVTHRELRDHFESEEDYRVEVRHEIKGNGIESVLIGRSGNDDTHSGDWAVVDGDLLLLKSGGVAGNSDEGHKLGSLSKDEAVSKITSFVGA